MVLKPTFGIRVVLASKECLCCWGVLLGLVVDPVQWDIYEINSNDETTLQGVEI